MTEQIEHHVSSLLPVQHMVQSVVQAPRMKIAESCTFTFCGRAQRTVLLHSG